MSVRASIKPDYLVCMECGSKQKMLKRHLQTSHHMSPDQYRKDYGLPSDYPMVAPEYSERRSGMAKALGFGRRKGVDAPAATTAEGSKTARARRKKAPAGGE